MRNRIALNMRIDAELHALLKKRAKGNLTAHVESLTVKGIVANMHDLYERAIDKGDAFRKTVEEKEIIEL